MTLFDQGWLYRQSNSVTNASSGRQFILKIHSGVGVNTSTDVYCNNHAKADFSDIRFTLSDGVSSLNYELESIVSGVSCTAIIEMTFSTTQTIYMFYGNPSATNIGTLVKNTSQVQSTISIDNAPGSQGGGGGCAIFYDQVVNAPVPSNLYSAIWSDAGSVSSGIFVDDIEVLYVNGVQAGAASLVGNSCGISGTVPQGGSPIDITSSLAGLTGQNVTFEAKAIDANPPTRAAFNTMVTLYATYDFINIWGSEQTPPTITSWSNNKTGNSALILSIVTTEQVLFNVTADQSITTWTWKIDGVDQNNNSSSFNTYISQGTHTITASGTNSVSHTGTITWNVTVSPIVTVQSIGSVRFGSSKKGSSIKKATSKGLSLK